MVFERSHIDLFDGLVYEGGLDHAPDILFLGILQILIMHFKVEVFELYLFFPCSENPFSSFPYHPGIGVFV